MDHGEFQELCAYIEKSKIFTNWHWFNYHFSRVMSHAEPFAFSIVTSCLQCEEYLPGFAKNFIDAIAALSGREKDRNQYEQLLQRLSELFVIKQIVTYSWPNRAKFEIEPTAGSSGKNPEISINYSNVLIGIEVKMPSLLNHIEKRASNAWQIPYRGPWKETVEAIEPTKVTLPRDNPIVDFLKSANDKFKEFRALDEDFYGVLVIVWDDHIYEPISTLLGDSALFTETSWARDEDGVPLRFENVDGVVVIPHLHQFIRAAGGRPLLDGKTTAFDYGKDGIFPYKAFISNPAGREVPEELLQCLQAHAPTAEMGAEYVPSEIVMWIGGERAE